jgi:hypothetical protein
MRRIFRPLAAAALVALVAVALPSATKGVAQEATISRFSVPAAPPQAAMLKREEDLALERAEEAVREMQAVAKTESEKELANNDSRIVAEIRRLVLQRQVARSSGSTQGAATSSGSSALTTATRQMQETQMSFNLQYLMLQSQMQNDNRQFTAVSNIMKTKHDTVKNSLSNIR